MPEKIYIGHRVEGPDALGTRVSKIEDGEGDDLPLRLDLWNHSPTGFEWGYGGSGTAQLALAILADATGDDVCAVAKRQYFKSSVIAGLDRDQWHLAEAEVLEWAANHPLPENERFHWLPGEQQVQILDREIVAELPSECCEAPCYFEASYKGGRYQPVAICAKCGSAIEF